MPQPARRLATIVLALALLASGRLAACADEAVKTGVAAFGLWSDPVFGFEAAGAAKVVAARYGHGGAVVVTVNTTERFATTPDGMTKAMRAAQRGLDPERDVLFLVLTSHGSPAGIAEKGGGREALLSPDALAGILGRSSVRRKVLVVSACFSGLYTALADADTLVITAADASHSSFGCVPEARWTYFGDAFFNQALRRTGSIRQAFEEARQIVAAREGAQRLAPSNPQIAGGENVVEALDSAP